MAISVLRLWHALRGSVDGRTHPVKLLAAAISGSCTSPTQPVPVPIGYQKNTNANTKNILDTNRDVLGASVSARKPILSVVQIPILLKWQGT